MTLLLLGTHLWMTFRTRGVQRKMWTALRLSVRGGKGAGDISSFGALMVALAATMGTGNIIGMGTAVALGGPGAILWCWLIGLLGIATKYAESLLAVKYRVKDEEGRLLGGAMVLLDKVLHLRWLAVLFCLFTIIAAFGIGNMSQSNAVAVLVERHFSVPAWMTGLAVAALVALVTLGGIRSLSRVCTWLVPFMAIFYIVGCLALLGRHWDLLGQAFALIVRDAFSPAATMGGIAGGGILLSMRYGFARGLFSNEAGMGSSPIVSATAKTRNAVEQGLIASTAVFWDTVVVCALTGLVLVTSVLAYPDMQFEDGAVLATQAFAKLHRWGGPVMTIALITFVFSTLLGWSYYAESSIRYLGGCRWILVFRFIWVAAVFLGAVSHLNLVWSFSDCANALMAIPNLIAVMLLGKTVCKETDYYLYDRHLDEEDPEIQQ